MFHEIDLFDKTYCLPDTIFYKTILFKLIITLNFELTTEMLYSYENLIVYNDLKCYLEDLSFRCLLILVKLIFNH